MKFDLRKPCVDCPFRKDALPGWLGAERSQEIADALLTEDKTFACHKTVEHHEQEVEEGDIDQDELDASLADRQHCAGAIAMVEAEGAANSMLQISERLGIRDPDRVTDEGRALSFESGKDFVAHHAKERATVVGRTERARRSPKNFGGVHGSAGTA